MLGTLLTDKIFNIIDNKKVKAATKEQNNYLQAIFDAYNSGGSSRGIKENLGENSRFTPEIENYLDSLDEAKKKGQEVKASLEDFGDGSQFKRIAEEANETSEAMKKVGDTGKQAAEGTENIGEAAASAAEGMENVSKSSTTAGTSMSKVASVGKAVLGTLANIAIYYAISEAITLAAEAWDNYANAQENAIERGNTALANMDISIHTPARGVTSIDPPLPSKISISIHTPARGVTYQMRVHPSFNSDFNPHSREGSDFIFPRLQRIYLYFNPHSREGSDIIRKSEFSSHKSFQSTLPRGE